MVDLSKVEHSIRTSAKIFRILQNGNPEDAEIAKVQPKRFEN